MFLIAFLLIENTYSLSQQSDFTTFHFPPCDHDNLWLQVTNYWKLPCLTAKINPERPPFSGRKCTDGQMTTGQVSQIKVWYSCDPSKNAFSPMETQHRIRNEKQYFATLGHLLWASHICKARTSPVELHASSRCDAGRFPRNLICLQSTKIQNQPDEGEKQLLLNPNPSKVLKAPVSALNFSPV